MAKLKHRVECPRWRRMSAACTCSERDRLTSHTRCPLCNSQLQRNNSAEATFCYSCHMDWASPHQRHQRTEHTMSRFSPNGIDIIEECNDCGARFLHHPGDNHPITLPARWPNNPREQVF